jgi:hypothetical protein
MFKRTSILTVATLALVATLSSATTGCARYTSNSAAGDVIDPADAASSVVLRVQNINISPMELRAVLNGRSYFVGSVGGNDSTSVLLDPTLFPTGFLYVVAIPANGRGRASVGPLSAGKGDKIQFIVRPELDLSSAIVVR